MDSHHIVQSLFGVRRALIGVVHLNALPGTPSSTLDIATIAGRAVDEARAYRDAGYDAVLLENTHDRPYLKGDVGPEIVAAMAAIGGEVRRATTLPLGIQILAGANMAAIAAAVACGASFVRVEGFVFAHVADEGIIQSCAGELLRYRRAIGAERVLVFADIKKKHSAHAITADVSIAETAHAAELFLADGLIVTGAATGVETSPQDVAAAAGAAGLPILVGSGLTAANISRFSAAHGFIVGTSMKQDGRWELALDRDRVDAIARAFTALPVNL